MSDRDRARPTDGWSGDDERRLGELMERAELPRRTLDVAAMREAVESEWLAKVARQRRRGWRRRAIFAVAASALAALVGWWGFRGVAPKNAVATVASQSGEVRLEGETASGLVAGALVSTGPNGRAALRLSNGSSLRVDRDSRLRLLSGASMELEAGAVYLDSGAEVDGPGVLVETSAGSVTEIGTQYEVRLEEDELLVRVREGAVRVDSDGNAYDAHAGEGLRVSAGELLERLAIPRNASVWGWAVELAPALDIEGRSLAELFSWAAREGGWHLEYTTDGLEAESRAVTLSGSIAGLTIEEALELTTEGSGIHGEVRGDTLVIVADAGDRQD